MVIMSWAHGAWAVLAIVTLMQYCNIKAVVSGEAFASGGTEMIV
jgi:hypothetical protein